MHFIVPSLPMYSFLRVWPTVNTLMMLKKDKHFLPGMVIISLHILIGHIMNYKWTSVDWMWTIILKGKTHFKLRIRYFFEVAKTESKCTINVIIYMYTIQTCKFNGLKLLIKTWKKGLQLILVMICFYKYM